MYMLFFMLSSEGFFVEQQGGWYPIRRVGSTGKLPLLERLPNSRTRLEGTTWYRHSLWPAAYWRLWSDGIIHTIHVRVLRHIKGNVEEA
jgi:hypothetical protein